MEVPNLSEMDEVRCPDCGKPLVVTLAEHNPNQAVFDGCGCGRKIYNVPDGILAGFSRGPFFLYVPKSI